MKKKWNRYPEGEEEAVVYRPVRTVDSLSVLMI